MSPTPPRIDGVNHLSRTVTDIDVSISWYQRVFGFNRVPVPFPHRGSEQSGYGILLTDPNSDLAVGLHHHHANRGDAFDGTRNGLDHIGFAVPDRTVPVAWADWLDSLGVSHSGVVDTTEPVGYSVLVFRDPDNIQLELFTMRPAN